MLEYHLYIIGNIDATVIAQKPKLFPYREQMTKNIAKALKISENQICVKATTEEGLGFTGRGEGIAAQAIALLNTVENYIYDYHISETMADKEEAVKRNCTNCSGCTKKVEGKL